MVQDSVPLSGRCSVALKCSSTGLECDAADRACAEKARLHDLEVVCDQGTRFVYCPRGAIAKDSSVVWILLLVAVVIAIAGGAAFIFATRRKA